MSSFQESAEYGHGDGMEFVAVGLNAEEGLYPSGMSSALSVPLSSGCEAFNGGSGPVILGLNGPKPVEPHTANSNQHSPFVPPF